MKKIRNWIANLLRKISFWLLNEKNVNVLSVSESNPWAKLHNYIVNFDGKIYGKKVDYKSYYRENEDLVYEIIIPFNDYQLSFSKDDIDYMVNGTYQKHELSQYLPKPKDFYYNLLRLKLAKQEALVEMDKAKAEEKRHIQTLFGGL